MKIIVRAKPNAKKESVERSEQPTLDLDIKNPKVVEYKVSVKEPPIDGKANEAIIRVLAEYFDVPKSNVVFVSGVFSKRKIFEIYEK